MKYEGVCLAKVFERHGGKITARGGPEYALRFREIGPYMNSTGLTPLLL
jgi:hypothetical protein